MFDTILLASDGSDCALKAAEAAANIAKAFGSKVILVNVFNPATVPVPFVGVPGASDYLETSYGDYAECVQTAVEKSTGKALDEAQVRYECRREIGHPVDRIVSLAQDEKADLIVLGSRGMSRWQSFLLGSISDGVLHHASCPVLVVR